MSDPEKINGKSLEAMVEELPDEMAAVGAPVVPSPEEEGERRPWMNQETKQTLWTLAWLVGTWLVCGWLGWRLAWSEADAHWELESIKAGHGAYYLDSRHVRRWRWLSKPQQEPE